MLIRAYEKGNSYAIKIFVRQQYYSNFGIILLNFLNIISNNKSKKRWIRWRQKRVQQK